MTAYINDRKEELDKQRDSLRLHLSSLDEYNRELISMEEEFRYNAVRFRELSDLLYESYPHDTKLKQLLTIHEETLKKMTKDEKSFLADCWDAISDERKMTEEQLADYDKEMRELEDKEMIVVNEDNLHIDLK